MWFEACRYELKLQLRSTNTHIVLVLALVIACLQASGHSSTFIAPVPVHGAPLGTVWGIGICLLALPILCALPISSVALRETNSKSEYWLEILAWPKGYQFGKVLASCLLCLLVGLALSIPFLAIFLFPELSVRPLATFDWRPFYWALVLFVMPGAFVTGITVYVATAHSKSGSMAFVSAMFLYLLLLLASVASPLMPWAGLGDPFGVRLFTSEVMLVVPFAERATAGVIPGERFLLNRALWLAFSMALLVVALEAKGRSVGRVPSFSDSPAQEKLRGWAMRWTFGLPDSAHSLLHFVFRDYSTLLRSKTWRIAIPLLVLVLLNGMGRVEAPFYYPSTLTNSILLGAIGGMFTWCAYLVVALITAEVVNRENEVGVAPVFDCIWQLSCLRLASKALICSSAAFLVVVIGGTCLAAYAFIMGGGWPDSKYWIGLAMAAAPVVLLSLILIPVYVLAGSRSGGYAAGIVSAGVCFVFGNQLEFGEVFYFGRFPKVWQSDVLGFTGISTWAIYLCYWGVWVFLLWLAMRIRQERDLLGRRRLQVMVFVLCGLGAALGAKVYGDRKDPTILRAARIAYEKEQRMFAGEAQPRLEEVTLRVDVYPDAKTVDIRGKLRFRNHHTAGIGEVLVNIPPRVQFHELKLSTGHETYSGILYRRVRFNQPLAPGAEFLVDFEAAIAPQAVGFEQLWSSGVYLPNEVFVPSLGYNPAIELVTRELREKAGLGEATVSLGNVADSEAVYGHPNIVRANTTIEIGIPQKWHAVAPGELDGELLERGRRLVRYVSSKPIVPTFAILAGPWSISRGQSGRVQVFSSDYHVTNALAFAKGSEIALRYYEELFGGYGRGQLRVVEVSSLVHAAQSFDGVVAVPETYGFLSDLRRTGMYARLRDKIAVDPSVLISAHEVAHQWWGFGVLPANVVGSPFVIESVSQFLALSVLRDVQGSERWRAAMRQQQREYFEGRVRYPDIERPLIRTNTGTHLLYAKGSIALFRLSDAIGAEVLEGALSSYYEKLIVNDRRATPAGFVSHLKGAAAGRSHLVHELFEDVVVYDLVASGGSIEARNRDGAVRVHYEVEVNRFGQGPGDSYPSPVTVEWRGGGKSIFVQRMELPVGKHQLQVVLRSSPDEFVVDPDHLFLDRNVSNNQRSVH